LFVIANHFNLQAIGDIDYDVVHANAEFRDQSSDHDPQVMLAGAPPSAAIASLADNLDRSSLPKGLSDSLRAHLTRAPKQLGNGNAADDAAACGELRALLDEVDARRGAGDLSAADAAELARVGGEIRSALGCS
jgi:hypothetical protein